MAPARLAARPAASRVDWSRVTRVGARTSATTRPTCQSARGRPHQGQERHVPASSAGPWASPAPARRASPRPRSASRAAASAADRRPQRRRQPADQGGAQVPPPLVLVCRDDGTQRSARLPGDPARGIPGGGGDGTAARGDGCRHSVDRRAAPGTQRTAGPVAERARCGQHEVDEVGEHRLNPVAHRSAHATSHPSEPVDGRASDASGLWSGSAGGDDDVGALDRARATAARHGSARCRRTSSRGCRARLPRT